MILQDVYKITIINEEEENKIDSIVYKGTDIIHAETIICKLIRERKTILIEVF